METEITYPMSIKLTKWNGNYFAQNAFSLKQRIVGLTMLAVNVIVLGVGID